MRALALTLAFVFVAQPGYAASKQQCVASFGTAQTARNASRLLDARAELRTCASADCPLVVRQKCVEWLGEVESAIPSIIVTAKSADGHDVSDASLTIDGAERGARLDGKPIELDPGEHTIKLVHDGKTIEKKVLVAQGVKNRVVTIDLPAPAVEQPVKQPVKEESKSLAPVIVATTISVVGFGSFAFFGLRTRSQLADMRDHCAPGCDQSDVDSARRSALIADISLGVGVVSLGVATVLVLMRGSEPRTPEKPAALRVVPSFDVANRGPTLWLGGVF